LSNYIHSLAYQVTLIFDTLNAFIHKEPHLARISSCSCCSLKI
jgi:hypothetical protein